MEHVFIPIAPNEPHLLSGKLQLFIDATDSNLASSKFLDFFGIPQMSVTNVTTNGNNLNFKIAHAGGEIMPFSIDKTSTAVGFPTGGSAYSQARVNFVDANGNVSNFASAASIRHYRGTNGFVDYPVAGGMLKKFTTEEGREYTFPMPGVEVIRMDTAGTLRVNTGYGTGGIRQVKTLAGLIDVVSLSARSYEIREYKAEQVGPKQSGLYTVLSAPVFSLKIEAPANTTNQLFITHTSGSKVTVTKHEYQITLPAPAPVGGDPQIGSENWTQTIVSGDFEFTRDLKRKSRFEFGPSYRDEIRTATLTKTPAGLSVFPAASHYSFEAINIGYRPVSIKEKFFTGKVHNQTFTYETPSWDSEGVARPKEQGTTKGGSYGYNYKPDGRMTQRTTNRSRNLASGGDSPSTKIEEYNYTPLSQTEIMTPADFRPRKTEVKEGNVVVGVEYFSAFSANGSYIERKETSSNINAAYGDPANRFSETAWYGSGVHKGRIQRLLDDSGSLTKYEYALLPNNGLQTTTFSRLDRTENPVAGHSTRTTEKRNVRGFTTEITRAVWLGSAWSDYETLFNSYDVYGNLTRRDRKDLLSNITRTLLVQEWDSSRLTRKIDEEGIETRYTYYSNTEHLKSVRRLAVPANGDLAAQPEILTTYTGQFTINQKQEPDWSTRITTITAGSLSLTETEVFDEKGRIISHTDENGLVTTTLYSTDDLKTTVTRPDGGTIITSMDSEGRTLSVTGSAVVPRFYHYQPYTGQGGGTLTTVFSGTDNGPRFQRTLTDAAGRVIEMTQPRFGGSGNSVSSYAYATGNEQRTSPISISRTGQATEVSGYNSIGQLNRSGNSADDSMLTPASATDRISDVEHSFEQDSSGIWQITRSYTYPNANSATRKPVGTTRQKLAGFTAPEISRSESIDLSGNLTTSFTTLTGATRTATTVSPIGTKQIQISQAGRVASSSLITANSALITSSTSTYDSLGRQLSQKNSRHTQATTITYVSGKNQVASQTDPAGNTTHFSYYPQGSLGAGKIRSTQLPDGSVNYQAYNQRGESIASWGSQTNTTWREYNSLGEMTALHTWQVSPTLNPDSMPASIPAGSAKTTWNYDPASGLLISKRDAENKGATYTYDSANRLATRTWARGISTTYSYDNFGQLLLTDYSDSTSDIAMSYDRLGRKTSDSTLITSSSYSYNTDNLQIDTETITYNLPNQPTFTRVIDRSQDTLGRDTGWTLGTPTPSSAIENRVEYNYSATEGRLSTIRRGDIPVPQEFNYTYTANSNLLANVSGPAHTVTNVYEENRDVLASKVQRKLDNTIVSSYFYTVNNLGQRTAVNTDGIAFAATRNIAWGYDSLGQLTSADSSENTQDRAYQYDGIGNRQSGGGLNPPSQTSYTANALNQYTAIGSLNPVHDNDGNMTSGPLPANVNASSTLVWDGENRLIEAQVNSGATVSYVYDSQSRRIAESSTINNQLSTIIYIYDGWNPIAKYTVQNSLFTIHSSFTWGIDLSGSMQGAGGVGGLLAVTDSSGTHYPTYDGNGNVSEYLDATGATVAHYEYDPFGKTTVATGSKANDFAHRFSTKPLDAATGLYYYGYRFYDPATGRWPSRDPIQELGGVNLYAFVRNDGVNRWDLLGLAYVPPCSDCEKLLDDCLIAVDNYYNNATAVNEKIYTDAMRAHELVVAAEKAKCPSGALGAACRIAVDRSSDPAKMLIEAIYGIGIDSIKFHTTNKKISCRVKYVDCSLERTLSKLRCICK